MEFLNIATNPLFVLGLAIISLYGLPNVEKNIFSLSNREKTGIRLQKIVAWANSKRQKKSSQVTLSSFSNFFNYFFGKSHKSIRCITVSAILTLILTILSLVLIQAIFGSEVYGDILNVFWYKNNYVFLLFALITNIIIDYLSLLETRFVVKLISKEGNIFTVIFFLLIDLVATFIIFIFLFSLLKSTFDFFQILPFYDSPKDLIINHGDSISVLINIENGWLENCFKYFISVLKYSFVSCWQILESGFQEYWFSSFYLPEGSNTYAIHSSTMWLTTHFSSIYIYLMLILLWLTKLAFVGRMFISFLSKLPLFTKDIDSDINPYSTMIVNVFMYYFMILGSWWVIQRIITGVGKVLMNG